jgi:hypothetical protein
MYTYLVGGERAIKNELAKYSSRKNGTLLARGVKSYLHSYQIFDIYLVPCPLCSLSLLYLMDDFPQESME